MLLIVSETAYIYLFQLNVDNFVRKIWRKKKIFQLHIVKLLRKF